MIQFARTDDDLRRCHPVMAQLRPHIDECGFIEQVRRQQAEGYRVVVLEEEGQVCAVAGFRIMETLVSGRHMYVDDLVTDEASRSGGHGGRLFDWLIRHAAEKGCVELQLDSGVQRDRAHRFYFHKGMRISSFHFRMSIGS